MKRFQWKWIFIGSKTCYTIWRPFWFAMAPILNLKWLEKYKNPPIWAKFCFQVNYDVANCYPSLVCYGGHIESKMAAKIQNSSDLDEIWFPSRLWCCELISIIWEPFNDPSDHIISCYYGSQTKVVRHIVFALFLIFIIMAPKRSLWDILFLLCFLLVLLLLRHPDCCRVTYCYSTFLFHYYYSYYYSSSTHFCPLDFSKMPWSNFMKPCKNIICHVKLCF